MAISFGIGSVQAVMLIFLLVFLLLMAIFAARLRQGRAPRLRPIPGYDRLRRFIGQAAESGRPVHVSLGVQGVGGTDTTTALAGLIVFDSLARQAALYDIQPVVTLADPTMLLAAQDVIRQAYQRRDRLPNYDPTKVRFVASSPVAYAAGAADTLAHEPLTGNAIVGIFSDEYLLLGQAALQQELPQVAGAPDMRALPYMYTTADETLIGEEIFAAGAYLSQLPSHIASLMAQDWMRILVALLILGGVILKTVL